MIAGDAVMIPNDHTTTFVTLRIFSCDIDYIYLLILLVQVHEISPILRDFARTILLLFVKYNFKKIATSFVYLPCMFNASHILHHVRSKICLRVKMLHVILRIKRRLIERSLAASVIFEMALTVTSRLRCNISCMTGY